MSRKNIYINLPADVVGDPPQEKNHVMVTIKLDKFAYLTYYITFKHKFYLTAKVESGGSSGQSTLGAGTEKVVKRAHMA